MFYPASCLSGDGLDRPSWPSRLPHASWPGQRNPAPNRGTDVPRRPGHLLHARQPRPGG